MAIWKVTSCRSVTWIENLSGAGSDRQNGYRDGLTPMQSVSRDLPVCEGQSYLQDHRTVRLWGPVAGQAQRSLGSGLLAGVVTSSDEVGRWRR